MEPVSQPTPQPVPEPVEPAAPAAQPKRSATSIDELLEQVVVRGSSDLHVTVGSEPVVRVNGRLERLVEFNRLSPEDTQRMLYRILST
ncbi:MAG: type IV pili twitching motility protein PilT, partial [Gaiellaceae bacterium]